MVLQVKVLVANLNELSSIPKPHIVEEKNGFLQIVLYLSHAGYSTLMHIVCTHKNTYTK